MTSKFTFISTTGPNLDYYRGSAQILIPDVLNSAVISYIVSSVRHGSESTKAITTGSLYDLIFFTFDNAAAEAILNISQSIFQLKNGVHHTPDQRLSIMHLIKMVDDLLTYQPSNSSASAHTSVNTLCLAVRIFLQFLLPSSASVKESHNVQPPNLVPFYKVQISDCAHL